MANRLQAVVDHLRGTSLSKHQAKNPDDVVITTALRTPLCKARKGSFKDTSSDELLISLFKAAKSSIGIDPALIGDM